MTLSGQSFYKTLLEIYLLEIARKGARLLQKAICNTDERRIHKYRAETVARTIHEPHGFERIAKEENLSAEDMQGSANVRLAQLIAVEGYDYWHNVGSRWSGTHRSRP